MSLRQNCQHRQRKSEQLKRNDGDFSRFKILRAVIRLAHNIKYYAFSSRNTKLHVFGAYVVLVPEDKIATFPKRTMVPLIVDIEQQEYTKEKITEIDNQQCVHIAKSDKDRRNQQTINSVSC